MTMKFDKNGNYLGATNREIPEGFDEVLIIKFEKPGDGGRIFGFGSDESDPPAAHGEARWNTPGWNSRFFPYRYNLLGDLFPFDDIEAIGNRIYGIINAR